MRVPDDVFAQICAEMAAAEQSGELEQLFKGKTRAPDQQTGRETFKETIKPSMKLTKRTFLNILAYDIQRRAMRMKCLRGWNYLDAAGRGSITRW